MNFIHVMCFQPTSNCSETTTKWTTKGGSTSTTTTTTKRVHSDGHTIRTDTFTSSSNNNRQGGQMAKDKMFKS